MRIDPTDLIGRVVGELTVLQVAGRANDGELLYMCKCSCGNTKIARRSCLRRGQTRSCGHLLLTDFQPESLVGRRYGEWTVLSFSHRLDNQWYYNCRCSCGNESIIPKGNLERGLSKSCGKCAEPWIEKCEGYCRYVFSDGKAFTFDYIDLPLVESRRWTMNAGGYPVESVNHSEQLSRLILDLKDDEYADHINMDPTDNRRANLRMCTWSENNCNKVLQSNNTSGFKGVSFNRASSKYMALAYKDRKVFYGGIYPSKEEAALAYDELARQLHGEFARLNFPREGERGCREAI